MKTILHLLVLAALALSAGTGLAQSQPAPAEAAPATAPAVAAPAPAPALAPGETKPAPEAPASAPAATNAQAQVASAELVPLIVIDDVPLLDAVKNLARQANLNFQFDPRVNTMSNQPNVTVRFENVTAEDALTAVLENYGLALQHDVKRHISRITIKDAKVEEPLISKVMQLKYTSPTNMVGLLKSTLSPRSQVLPDVRTSQIIVITTEREMTGVEELLVKLDKPTKQILIEAQMWETAKNPQTVKGIDWSGTLEAQRVTFGNGQTVGQSTESSQSSSSITRPGSTTTTPGGRDITATEDRKSSSGSSAQTVLNTLTGGGGLGLNTAMGFHPVTAFLNADGLSAVISFLNKDSDTELVATPRTVTLDNEMANLNVSRAYPVYKITPGSANSPAGSEITWTNVGVILQVTPRISGDNNIALNVTPELSDIAAVDKQIINGQAYTANIYGIRKVETRVVIQSGKTLVMGGLISDRSFKAYTKVPVLGDAPIFGLLFRKDEKKRDKSNLMIFVTPTILAEEDLQQNKPSGWLKTEFKPKEVEKPTTWWDEGTPYDWTKPSSEEAMQKTADSKKGKL
jgi:type II secretory pathway component GspD/PulD (secretin)